jgi:hypothetical protein
VYALVSIDSVHGPRECIQQTICELDTRTPKFLQGPGARCSSSWSSLLNSAGQNIDSQINSPGQEWWVAAFVLLGKMGLQSLSVPFSPGRETNPSLLSYRVGPLIALAVAHSVTVPVPASFRTARASTVCALRSSSDEDPGALAFGEWPAPGAHVPTSLRVLKTSLQAPELQMACLACPPGNPQQRAWLSLGRTLRALGRLDYSAFRELEGRGLELWLEPLSFVPSLSKLLYVKVEGAGHRSRQTALWENPSGP